MSENGTSSKRPVTFLYNGGPGSPSVYLLLGSFGPRRIKTSGTHYTPPAPYALKDNQESLLDQTDLVFIDPVGTAYSTAIAPHKNSDFWGVDEDAGSIAQFVKRHLTAFNRWNSPNSCTANLTEHPEPALLLGCFMRRAWTLMG